MCFIVILPHKQQCFFGSQMIVFTTIFSFILNHFTLYVLGFMCFSCKRQRKCSRSGLETFVYLVDCFPQLWTKKRLTLSIFILKILVCLDTQELLCTSVLCRNMKSSEKKTLSHFLQHQPRCHSPFIIIYLGC